MNELTATRAKLKCLEMVEGTGLNWYEVAKFAGYERKTPLEFSYPTACYTFALGVVEGKPVWEGDTLYCNGISIHAVPELCNFKLKSWSWNPPKPKNIKTEKLQELLDIQSACDCVSDSYFCGMYNGMELMLSCIEEREAKFINKP